MSNEYPAVPEKLKAFAGDLNEIRKSLEEMALIYYSGMTEMEAKINIINEDFKTRYKYNPIHHVESRIKSPESIVKKMLRNEYPLSLESMNQYIKDIVGVRIVCSFLTDIPYLVKFIKLNKDIEVLEEQDYIEHPKESGYRSYHMLVKIPVTLTTGREYVNVEIQIRTLAMDFWASLEHKLNYKFEGYVPDYVKDELISCAKVVDDLDEKMEKLNSIVKTSNT